MAWTAPFTAVASTVLTAAQLNTNLRDNLNQTGPALVTAAGQILVSTAANAMAARTLAQASTLTSDTTTSTTYTANLASTSGPAVTATTGTQALVCIYASCSNSGTAAALMAWAVSGATTAAASDDSSIGSSGTASTGTRSSGIFLQTGLTAGSNTFTANYRVGSGTGTYVSRRIVVIPL